MQARKRESLSPPPMAWELNTFRAGVEGETWLEFETGKDAGGMEFPSCLTVFMNLIQSFV